MLADDLIETESLQAPLLRLREGLAGLDAAELEPVAGEDDPGALLFRRLQQFHRFSGAKQAHLVDDPHLVATGQAVEQARRGAVPRQVRQEAVHGLPFQMEGLAERLGGGGGRREGPHGVARGAGGSGDGGEYSGGLGGAGRALQHDDPVA